MLLQENTIFDKRYQLIRLLGRGGFSEVWLAKDSYTKLDIAVKVYAPGQGMDSDGLKEFSAELAGVFNLNHSSLLKPTHVDVWEGMPYLIMPYCAQGAISKRIGKMTENEIWKLIHDVASGLVYLHKNDIVHQDIKPDNILLDDNGNYVITDFGISAKARSTLRKSVIGGATSGGTMAYMGPERFSKQPAPTKASDIWSFGAMVYEMITGNVPFGELGGSMQKAGAEIPEITEPVSEELRSLVEQMLAPEPWNRPTAEQLLSNKRSSSQSKSTDSISEKAQPVHGVDREIIEPLKNIKNKTWEKTIKFSSLVLLLAGCVANAGFAISSIMESMSSRYDEWRIYPAILFNILCVFCVKFFINSIKKQTENIQEHHKSIMKSLWFVIIFSIGVFFIEFLMDNYYNAWIISSITVFPVIVGWLGLIWYDVITLRKNGIKNQLLLRERIYIVILALIVCAFTIVGYGRISVCCIYLNGFSLFMVCCALLLLVFVCTYKLLIAPYCPTNKRKVLLCSLLTCNLILDIILYFSLVSITYRGGSLGYSWYKNYIIKVKISNNVKQVDSNAFRNCYHIREICLPNDEAVDIKNVYLGDCSNLQAFTVSKTHSEYTVENGVLFNKDKSLLIRCPINKQTYTLPMSVTHIDEGAFRNCRIKSATLPNDLIVIGPYAFCGCYNLTSISIPRTVQYVGDYAFSSCSNLTEIKFHSRLDQSIFIVKEDAFKWCNRLEKIYVPQGYMAFYSQLYALREHKNQIEEFFQIAQEQ